MSTPTPIERERDSALNDDFSLDRALHIVRAFYEVYGGHETTAKYIDELADILIAVKHRARDRHQQAEAERLTLQAERDKEAQIAQLLN